MPTIIDIQGGSGKSPYELSDEQYFYCARNEMTTLADLETLGKSDAEIYMPKGYATLCLFQRLIFWDRANDIYRTYPETDKTSWVKNQYRLLTKIYNIQSLPTLGRSFASLSEVEEHIKNLQIFDPNAVLTVVRLLGEFYWH